MPTLMDFGILGFLLLLSGFFSGAETALFSLTKFEKKRMAENHPVMVKFVLDHLERPRRTLISVLIGNLIVNTFATAMVTLLAMRALGPARFGFAVGAFTLFLVVFGEIIPKTLAVRMNVLFSMIVAIPLRLFSMLIYPMRWLTRTVTEWVLSFLMLERKENLDQISEEELKTLVKIGEEDGVLDRDERRMLQKLLELGERPTKDIMTPRIDLAAIDIEDSEAQNVEKFQKYHFSRFLVYKETLDNILGVLPVQEYMLAQNREMTSLLTQPLFVPESKRIDDLLADFRNKNIHFAVCVDEFGGTAGIVTLEDILEEIFGEFYDEYSKVEKPIRPFGHQEYLVEAKIALSEFNEFFSSKLEADEASTLGGFILEKLGEVPEKGKVLIAEPFEIRIYDVIRQRRIRSVIVKVHS